MTEQSNCEICNGQLMRGGWEAPPYFHNRCAANEIERLHGLLSRIATARTVGTRHLAGASVHDLQAMAKEAIG